MQKQKTKRLTNFDKQWKQIKKKGIRISKTVFRQYYEDVRKANRKLGAKTYKSKTLDTRRFSYAISHIKTTSEFKKRMKTVQSVLTRGYRVKHNLEIRNILNDRITEIFEGSGEILKQQFAQLTDNELLEFMQENPDVNQLQYLYGELLENYISLIGLTAEKISGRLTYQFKEIKIKKR